MEKERYIDRVRERPAGEEEQVSFVVGPRGKVEVGERGVAGVVRRVYAKRDVEAEELEKRLERSLGVGFAGSRKVVRGQGEGGRVEGEARVEEEGDGAGEESVARRGAGRPRRSRRGEEDVDE